MNQSDIRPTILKMLVADVPRNLERFDPSTGRFLTGDGWAVTNQDIVYSLALLYTTQHPDNPYYQDQEILDYILRGGDAWRDFQYPDGKVEFVKVDGSKWGPIYMPWSMYHWVETYALVRHELDAERRERWEAGLSLAYDGITADLASGRVHNIPAWNAMASFRAGEVFGRTDWQEAGRKLLYKTVEEQHPHGYWLEHGGPTPSYNLVYLHALGLYYHFSGDEHVLDSLQRGTQFHIAYTYPDGCLVETVDGRVKYHHRVIEVAYPAFTLFPEGRRYARMLLENLVPQRTGGSPDVSFLKASGSISAGDFGLNARLASGFVYYQEGEETPILQDQEAYHVHDPEHSLIRRQDGWFTCTSGFLTPPVESRWGLDRQAFCSVWHEKTGLIIGGGNAKDQPAFSNFVLSDTPFPPSEQGEPGTVPDTAAASAIYLPTAAKLHTTAERDMVELDYDGQKCFLSVEPEGPTKCVLQLDAPNANAAHPQGQLMLKIHPGECLRTGTGTEYTMDEARVSLTAEEAGNQLIYNNWRIHMPEGSTFEWPVAPFNPYAADGAAPLEEAAGILSLPLQSGSRQITIEII